MYLLDTDTIIYSLKGDDAVNRSLRQHIEAPMKICVITLMELYFGAYRSDRVAGNLAKVRMIENSFEILPIGRELAEIFGMLKSGLKRSGIPLDDFDLSIASCALAHNLTLVTNNERHFRRIEGLKLTNWSM